MNENTRIIFRTSWKNSRLPGWKQHIYSLIVVLLLVWLLLLLLRSDTFSRCYTVYRLQVLLMIATALEKEMMRTRLCHSDKMCHSFHYFDYFAIVLVLLKKKKKKINFHCFGLTIICQIHNNNYNKKHFFRSPSLILHIVHIKYE